ncbi:MULTISPECIES: transglycosylase SLT domain-containing protein [unclassified Serratia (in: enterobacteria)]|uniref:transglycosylase SLT domain-containing protein n=1 Tax=unclassified Serratia (in: enterobacteria) TaxID=2647522 RepID=UPI000503C26B|nr:MULTISPECIES: transglycosylase SLT domain-containing protein [unclassified Serratia (in: enterobacteria)]KFK93504.1 lytic transglycosylase [Serratia sp. Ag2]KFL00525.1 lytic transglycosylase [Serratia sp. Ag1]
MKHPFLALMMIGLALLLAGCAGKKPSGGYQPYSYQNAIEEAAAQYGVDEKLITAMIQVESGFNPGAVSQSNAIGLMQLKASTAGCDAYRYKGKRGCPDDDDLRDPQINIDLGTAYLASLQRQLGGIDNPVTLRYATEVAYVNGAGALLRTFSSDRQKAVSIINTLSPEAFHWHVRQHHPSPQAPRYMAKVEAAYKSL